MTLSNGQVTNCTFQLPLLSHSGIKKAVEEVRPKILFLTSPNNPDGSIVSDEDILVG